VRHYKNLAAFYHSDGLPSQLAFDLTILSGYKVRVVENERCGFEANPVFSPVGTVLSLVPSELQSASLCLDNFVYTVYHPVGLALNGWFDEVDEVRRVGSDPLMDKGFAITSQFTRRGRLLSVLVHRLESFVPRFLST
jgi:hypothetical protein